MVLNLRERILEGPGGVERPLTAEEMIALAAAVDLESLDLGEYCHFKSDCYARNTVFSNDHFELVVICWRPGQASAVHDHGTSRCLYLVVDGVLDEQLFELDDGGEPQPTQRRAWNRGDMTIAEGSTIHQISNPSGTDLLTVHIYSPPLGEAMTLFTPIPTST